MNKIKDTEHTQLAKEEKREGYVVVATKIHPLAARQLCKLCDRVGIKPYKMMQHVVACMIKMMGDKTIMEPNGTLHKLIGIFFSELNDFATRYNIADPAAEKEVTDAIYFLGDHKHTRGRQSVMVTPHQMHTKGLHFPADENWNVAQQLEFFLLNSDPYLYKKIRQAGARFGVQNTYEILHRIADEECTDTIVDDIRELFTDNRRSEYGTQPTDQPFKRKQRRDIEKIRFKPEDVPDLPELFPEDDLPFDSKNDGD